MEASVPKKKVPKIPLHCHECGKKWSVSASNPDPQCPQCGSVDYEVL